MTFHRRSRCLIGRLTLVEGPFVLRRSPLPVAQMLFSDGMWFISDDESVSRLLRFWTANDFLFELPRELCHKSSERVA
jgi:hypothetical protein